MKKKDPARRERGRVLALTVALALFFASAWVVFDELISPFDEGGESVTVPDYLGMQRDLIREPSWLEVHTEYRYDANAPAGEVLSQSPAGGSRRKLSEAGEKCRLTLTVSLGEERVMLPDLVGEDVRTVEAELRRRGFAVESRFSTGAYPEGCVLEMNPSGGRELPRGSRITLLVSAGSPAVTVTVPNVCGMERGEALTALWLSQLSVGEVIEEDSEEESGIVIRQSHPSGTVVMAGTKITLYVSRWRA